MFLKRLKSVIFYSLIGVIGILALITFSVSIYIGIKQISTTWVETIPVRFKVDKVQSRIREKSADYFFKIHFYYHANGKEYSFYADPGYRSRQEAKQKAGDYRMPNDFKIWYDESDPKTIETTKSRTLGQPFLNRSAISFLILLFIGWLLLRFNKKRTEPNI
jgi:hypothetical protein